MKIYCATTNPGKLREFQLAGDLLDVEIEPLPNLKEIVPPEENGWTFEENARIKAAYYSKFADAPLFADDSGLEIAVLGGEPGVLSARYAGPGASDEANNRLVLDRLGENANRQARFVCVIAVAERGIVREIFRSDVEGEIMGAPRGAAGFGYDPLFYYPPFGCTFGEVDAERKFRVSHRGNAFRLMLTHLRHFHSADPL